MIGREEPDYIYFIQGITTGRIKIGISKDPKKRLDRMQLSEQAVLLSAFRGSRITEQQLHIQFKKHRVHGEWFEPADEILQFIEKFDSEIDIFTDI